MKRCFKCGKEKPLEEFYKHPDTNDGHLGKCIECTKKDIKDHRKNNPGKVLKTRLSTCAKKPSKYAAHKAVEAALASGDLVNPGICSGCGQTSDEALISAHHYDYSKPLDVVWVCTKCHRQLDALRRTREGKPSFSRNRMVAMHINENDICKFESIAEAARSLNVSPSSISRCLDEENHTCKGFKWSYV